MLLRLGQRGYVSIFSQYLSTVSVQLFIFRCAADDQYNVVSSMGVPIEKYIESLFTLFRSRNVNAHT
jgi:hypothetical protein